MSESKEMKTREGSEMQPRSEQDVFLRPAVDIYEDGNEITVTADMPGVRVSRVSERIFRDSDQIR